ncbi:MFS transporter, PAT family, beta-lactamase induction signal transducer AmpG [Alphaproteobacteria bacterium]
MSRPNIMAFRIHKYITALALGVSSGLVYALLTSTLTAYLGDCGVSLVAIGLLSLRTIPYSFKFLWSPFVDNLHVRPFPKAFGQRKTWLITAQCILIVCVMVLGFIDVKHHILLFCALSLFIASMSATSDIALEGYRIELFTKTSELSCGSSLTALGFRVGLIISGAFGLYLASVYPWRTVFLCMGICLIPSLLVICLSNDERVINTQYSIKEFKLWFRENFIQAFITFAKLDKVWYTLLLVASYKVSDAYLGTMLIPFLTSVAFSKGEIAIAAKTIGITSAVIGTVVGGYYVNKLGVRWSLLTAEFLAAITNLLFILLVYFGHDNILLGVINGIENFAGGISNIVFIFYISSLCKNKKFTASHFAILISISAVTRTLLSGTSGWVVAEMGWMQFFIISALLSLPTFLCIYALYFKKPTTARLRTTCLVPSNGIIYEDGSE